MVTKDYSLKIGDFGVSMLNLKGPAIQAADKLGTPFYTAPELFMDPFTNDCYDARADVWSLGCILY